MRLEEQVELIRLGAIEQVPMTMYCRARARGRGGKTVEDQGNLRPRVRAIWAARRTTRIATDRKVNRGGPSREAQWLGKAHHWGSPSFFPRSVPRTGFVAERRSPFLPLLLP